MKVREYLDKKLNIANDVTFIVAKAEKDEHTPFYHSVYATTPIHTVSEWKDSKMMDYIILNDKQNPIDWLSGATWNNRFKSGDLTCMLVISQEDMYTLYSKEQADRMEKFIENKITTVDFKSLLEQSGMNMKQFSERFNIPYRTVQNWSSGERQAPEYVLELLKFRLDAESR